MVEATTNGRITPRPSFITRMERASDHAKSVCKKRLGTTKDPLSRTGDANAPLSGPEAECYV
jgi:hypothetical protein